MKRFLTFISLFFLLTSLPLFAQISLESIQGEWELDITQSHIKDEIHFWDISFEKLEQADSNIIKSINDIPYDDRKYLGIDSLLSINILSTKVEMKDYRGKPVPLNNAYLCFIQNDFGTQICLWDTDKKEIRKGFYGSVFELATNRILITHKRYGRISLIRKVDQQGINKLYNNKYPMFGALRGDVKNIKSVVYSLKWRGTNQFYNDDLRSLSKTTFNKEDNSRILEVKSSIGNNTKLFSQNSKKIRKQDSLYLSQFDEIWFYGPKKDKYLYKLMHSRNTFSDPEQVEIFRKKSVDSLIVQSFRPQTFLLFYDENNYVFKKEIYVDNDLSKVIFYQNTKFDNNGNWIEQIEYNITMDRNVPSFIYLHRINRKIEYCD